MTQETILYGLMLVKGGILLLVLLGASIAWLAICGLLFGAKTAVSNHVGASLVLGPMLLSWLFVKTLYFAPGLDRDFYLGLVLGSVGIGGVVSFLWLRAELYQKFRGYIASLFELRVRLVIIALAFLLVALLLAQMVFVQSVVPLTANDPLEYFSVARAIAEERSTRIYPILDRTETGGMTAGYTHPLGYGGLLTFAFLLQGDSTYSVGITRFVIPYFAFAQAALLIAFAGTARATAGWIAAALVLTVPFYFHLAHQAHIDILRLATFSTAVFMVWRLAQDGELRNAFLAAVAIGLSNFSHSIGILTLGFVIPLYVLIGHGGVVRILRNSVILVAGGLSFVALRLIKNLENFGSPFADATAVWGLEWIQAEQHLSVVRNLRTPFDKVINGMFAGFSDTTLFGLVYWIALVGLFYAVVTSRTLLQTAVSFVRDLRWRNGDPVYAAIIVIVGFYAMLGLTVIIGTDLAIKNPRYTMTVLPLVALVAGCVLNGLFAEGALRVSSFGRQTSESDEPGQEEERGA